ncbi:MAG TPA: energy transducer TonB [Novosphingobium sp.]|nr:energy transducer TonB [Novosphingobium sp.]
MAMGIRDVMAAAMAMLLAVPMPAHADDAVLAPSTPWVLDATPSGCALRRSFGSGEMPLILEMQRFAPGDNFQLNINGAELRGITASSALRVKYGALPHHEDPIPFNIGETAREGGKTLPTIFATSTLGDGHADDVPAAVTPQMETQADVITLQLRSRAITLKTGPLDKPFAVMRQCTDALVESWGLDPATQNSLSRRTKALGAQSWPKRIDYPSGQAARGQQARVNFRLLVGSDGKPTDCKVLRSYNEPAFDAAACRSLMSFARFEPALDRTGKPVASYYNGTIIWTIP